MVESRQKTTESPLMDIWHTGHCHLNDPENPPCFFVKQVIRIAHDPAPTPGRIDVQLLLAP